MEIKAIRTEADYLIALQEVSTLIDLDPAADSPEGERLDVLGTLVQAYEAKHYPMDPPDPIEAIKFRMDQSGMTVKDLIPYIGPLNRVYEVLAHKPSTVAQHDSTIERWIAYSCGNTDPRIGSS